MTLEEVEWLQVENTTRCNAWCPACPRNNSGHGLASGLVLEDLDLSRFEEVLNSLPNLTTVQFCGTFGDTLAASHAFEHIALASRYVKKIQIHTHGGLRNVSWWENLAELLQDVDHDVWFGLDGLKGIHEIHRQGTDFDKAIENARAFIKAGGHATWQFIPFAHNEHQIKSCLQLSQRLGFKKFKLITSVRERLSARHWRTGDPIEFLPWSKSAQTNPYRIIPVSDRINLKTSDCRHLTSKSLYLNANGNVSHCCYLNHDRQYKSMVMLDDIQKEIETTPDPKCLSICGNGVKIQEL
jgi:sulfatase maturation enzyme AslB (radical SAM superfamily)